MTTQAEKERAAKAMQLLILVALLLSRFDKPHFGWLVLACVLGIASWMMSFAEVRLLQSRSSSALRLRLVRIGQQVLWLTSVSPLVFYALLLIMK